MYKFSTYSCYMSIRCGTLLLKIFIAQVNRSMSLNAALKVQLILSVGSVYERTDTCGSVVPLLCPHNDIRKINNIYSIDKRLQTETLIA